MYQRIIFYLGLDTLEKGVQQECIEKAILYLSQLYGGATSTLTYGGWLDPEKVYSGEAAVKLEVITGNQLTVDLQKVAEHLARVFKNREVLVTQESLNIQFFLTIPDLKSAAQ